MLLKSLINKGVETVSDVYPEREAREMVFAFLEHHLGTKRHTHIVEPMYEVADDLAEEALSAFRRMASGEPLQYVTGFADFYGRKFRVTPDVLIPRPETEILCHNVLAEGMGCQGPSEHLATIPSVLDLCTGSGCIAWTLALEMPGADVTAVDISDGALAVASSQDFSEEIARTGARAPEFIKADVLAGPSLAGHYDILVSNPPYVMDKEKALMRANVLEHEPHLSLFVSDDDPLIFYRAIADWALAVLKPGGYCIVEINEALGPETAAIYEAAGFTEVRIVKDLSDRDRFVSFRR
jgi:release factor glutamine methyltransferase